MKTQRKLLLGLLLALVLSGVVSAVVADVGGFDSWGTIIG